MKRMDDYQERRKHLKDLTDEQLKERFWSLTENICKPLVDLANTHTSASIERSVLLRMGFSSMDADAIVKQGQTYNLLGKGMGNVVLTYSKMIDKPYIEAGLELASGIGWAEVDSKMRGDK